MAGNEQFILLQKRDQIGYITFNRPEKLNAIRWEDYILLDDLVNDCERDNNVRVIILTGKGRAFSAGDDIEGYPGSGEESVIKGDPGMAFIVEGKYLQAQLSGYQIPLQKTCLTLLNSGKVSIAAVNGVCWAPEILYAMDFVIAADVATFAQGDVRNGLCPGGASTQILPRLLGRRRAIEFLLMAEEISAEEAYRIGLVNKVVPLSQLMPEAEALAKKMIAHPLSSIQLVKQAVTKAQDLPLREGLEIEQWYSSISIQSEAFQAFYQEFLARKKLKASDTV
ncbi:MAG: enoyl-CoA hydratase/isomerase family protein [Dehalococcoidia bacterium]|nr:enoyl-CoA hydratase/isomerase family protein [Dehalococcoidia bacterium]